MPLRDRAVLVGTANGRAFAFVLAFPLKRGISCQGMPFVVVAFSHLPKCPTHHTHQLVLDLEYRTRAEDENRHFATLFGYAFGDFLYIRATALEGPHHS